MNIYLSTIAVTALAVSSAVAQAQTIDSDSNQLYGEIGYTSLKYKEDIGSTKLDLSPSVLGLTIGYNVHPNLAVEGTAAFGVSDDTNTYSYTVGGTSVPVSLSGKLDRAYGVFVKPKATLSDNVEVFGRLGYLRKSFTVTPSVSGYSFPIAGDDNGFAYGLGANYYFSKKTYLTINYTNFYTKDGTTSVDGLTFGVGTKF